MKRNLIGTVSLVMLSLLLSATGAFAQSGVTANVPFNFTVGNSQMAAGCYTIATLESMNVAAIRDCKRTASAYSSIQKGYPQDKNPKLVFHHLGGQYFLTEVRGLGGNMGLTLPTSKLEKELQIASGPSYRSEEVIVALK